jgi:hypothetical protein
MLDINGLLAEVAFIETTLWLRHSAKRKTTRGMKLKKDLHRGSAMALYSIFASS